MAKLVRAMTQSQTTFIQAADAFNAGKLADA
jgi:hypothetical protein